MRRLLLAILLVITAGAWSADVTPAALSCNPVTPLAWADHPLWDGNVTPQNDNGNEYFAYFHAPSLGLMPLFLQAHSDQGGWSSTLYFKRGRRYEMLWNLSSTLSYLPPSSAGLRIIPRSGKWPILAVRVTQVAPWFPPTETTTYRAYSLDTGLIQDYDPAELLTHSPAGDLVGFAVVGGRIGETVRGAPPLTIQEPSIPAPEPNSKLYAAGKSDTARVVVAGVGVKGLQLICWDSQTSYTVTLRPDDESAEGAANSQAKPLFCEPAPDGGWFVGVGLGYVAYLWKVSELEVKPCPWAGGASGWSLDLSEPAEPLFAYLGSVANGITLGAARWNSDMDSWVTVELAEAIPPSGADGVVIEDVAVGRDANGTGVVCFSKRVFRDFGRWGISDVSQGYYKVVLDGAGPIPVVPGENWVIR